MLDRAPAKTPPIDVFTTVHKGLRWWMGRMGASLGSASFAETTAEAVLAEVEKLLSALDAHALHEETFVVPLVLARAADRAVTWQADHQRLEVLEGAMRRQVEGIRRLGPSHPSAAALGLALYRTFNRLTAETFRHFDEEETLLMPLLWSVCTDEELQGLMTDFKARFGDDAMRLHRQLAVAYNPAERAALGV